MLDWLQPKVTLSNRQLRLILITGVKLGASFEQDKQVLKSQIQQLKQDKLEQQDILNQLLEKLAVYEKE